MKHPLENNFERVFRLANRAFGAMKPKGKPGEGARGEKMSAPKFWIERPQPRWFAYFAYFLGATLVRKSENPGWVGVWVGFWGFFAWGRRWRV